MAIKNERYWILSRGEPEILPEVKETIIFNLQKKGENNGGVTEAPVVTSYQELMTRNQESVRYGHIIGKTKINEEELPCEAKYQINKTIPKDEKIGELVVKRVTNEI